jgi:hypothetical protein
MENPFVDLDKRPPPMTSIELTAIPTLRQKGYAIAIWEPEEVGLADPRALEDQAVNSFPCGYPHKPTLMEIESTGAALF